MFVSSTLDPDKPEKTNMVGRSYGLKFSARVLKIVIVFISSTLMICSHNYPFRKLWEKNAYKIFNQIAKESIKRIVNS